MTVFSTSGAAVFTTCSATEALALCRLWISPAIRWEKKAIGSFSTFHMYVALPTAAILPFRRSEYTAWIQAAAS